MIALKLIFHLLFIFIVLFVFTCIIETILFKHNLNKKCDIAIKKKSTEERLKIYYSIKSISFYKLLFSFKYLNEKEQLTKEQLEFIQDI